jgi:hypothetical protein
VGPDLVEQHLERQSPVRHTTLTWVERHFGYGIARAYAGHTDTTGPATTTYIKADLQAVATALSAMTGEPQRASSCRGERTVILGWARDHGLRPSR